MKAIDITPAGYSFATLGHQLDVWRQGLMQGFLVAQLQQMWPFRFECLVNPPSKNKGFVDAGMLHMPAAMLGDDVARLKYQQWVSEVEYVLYKPSYTLERVIDFLIVSINPAVPVFEYWAKKTLGSEAHALAHQMHPGWRTERYDMERAIRCLAYANSDYLAHESSSLNLAIAKPFPYEFLLSENFKQEATELMRCKHV